MEVRLNTFKFALLFLFASVSQFSYAQQVTNSPDDDDAVVIVDDKTTREINKGSSEYNRINKNYLVTVQLYGYGPVSGRGVGLTLGKFLDRNSLVLFEGTRNTSDSEFSSTENIKNYSLGVHFKKYEKNSFYWRMGGDYRTTSFNISNGSSRAFESESVNFTAAIGNQWYWRSFTLGVDWLGASVPLISKIKSESASGAYTIASLDDDKKKYTTDTTYIFTRFYVGIAF